MCGICGIATHDGGDYDAVLTRMSLKLARRGPDGEGCRTFRHQGLTVRLGHRRLAIIDVLGSPQPMVSADTGTAITFNGEIYNYRALRSELEASGCRFETGGDTEVLLHGYDTWGLLPLIERIDGMYAFGLWDARRAQLVLARDPAGQKPLLYSSGPQGQLCFASTMDALRETPWFDATLDREALELFLCLRYVPAPLSIFKGARKLLPGEVLVWRDGAIRPVSRFQPTVNHSLRDNKAMDWTQAFGQGLDRCVRECLEADDPVSLFLSSGLDSGSVAVSLAQQSAPSPVRSFTAGFPGMECDESEAASVTAAALGLDNCVLPVDGDVLRLAKDNLLTQMDEPFADPSAIPTLGICSLAARHTKVALTGDGGDELFGGYPTFAAITPWRCVNRIPGAGLGELFTGLLPASDDLHAPAEKWRRFFQGVGHPAHRAFVRWLCVISPTRAARLLGSDGAAVDRLADREGGQADAGNDLFSLMSLLYFKIFLPGVLEKMDRCSMFHSLETRAPFLQRTLIELGTSMPTWAKRRGGASKAVMRDLLRQRAPGLAWGGPKRGFLPPLAQWLRGETGQELEAMLQSGALHCVLDAQEISRMLAEHRQGTANHAQALWSMYVLGHFLSTRSV